MSYICEEELVSIYNSVEPILLSSGLEPEIALIRDYLLKIKVSENDKVLGKLIIDYSPKRQTHNYRKDSDLPEEQFTRIIGILGGSEKLKEKSGSEKKNSNKQIGRAHV